MYKSSSEARVVKGDEGCTPPDLDLDPDRMAPDPTPDGTKVTLPFECSTSLEGLRGGRDDDVLAASDRPPLPGAALEGGAEEASRRRSTCGIG